MLSIRTVDLVEQVVLVVAARHRIPLMSRLAVGELFFITFRSLHCLGMLLASLKVHHGQSMPFPILPSHVHEFFLVREHVLFVQLVDLD